MKLTVKEGDGFPDKTLCGSKDTAVADYQVTDVERCTATAWTKRGELTPRGPSVGT